MMLYIDRMHFSTREQLIRTLPCRQLIALASSVVVFRWHRVHRRSPDMSKLRKLNRDWLTVSHVTGAVGTVARAQSDGGGGGHSAASVVTLPRNPQKVRIRGGDECIVEILSHPFDECDGMCSAATCYCT